MRAYSEFSESIKMVQTGHLKKGLIGAAPQKGKPVDKQWDNNGHHLINRWITGGTPLISTGIILEKAQTIKFGDKQQKNTETLKYPTNPTTKKE